MYNMDIDDLCDACGSGEANCVAYILNNNPGININGRDSNGRTPLEIAVMMTDIRIVEMLLTVPKTKLGVQTPSGESVLHQACFMNFLECVKLFTSDRRCTPDVLNKKTLEGNTGLMVAVYFGSLECVRLLVELPGIDLGPRTWDGKTLQDIAVDGKKLAKSTDRKMPGILTNMESRFKGFDTILMIIDEKQKNEVARNARILADHDHTIDNEEDKPKTVKAKREKICWSCLSPPSPTLKLYRCAGCRVAWYCGDECQREDRARHQDWCIKKTEKRKERKGLV